MRPIAFLCLAALVLAEPKPANLTVSTWVREDLFAGFMVNDLERFQNGMRKLDEIIAAAPGTPDALAWRGGGKLYLAVRAHEAGDVEKFRQLYAEARKDFDQGTASLAAGAQAPEAYYAIRGGTFTLFADRVPEALRRDAWTDARDSYRALHDKQKPYFDKLPVHMRGEVLSGLAQASQRLGEPAERWNALVNEMITALPDSPYAARGKRWIEKPELAGRTSLVCQTCHEPGRLEAVKSRMSSAAGTRN